MDAAERKRAIVEIAMPLFARKGFAGTTTKEVAEIAQVSEALLYRHFPNKAALYEEILELCCRGDPDLDRLEALPPSTATLVHMIHLLFRLLVAGEIGDPSTLGTRQRLVLQSLIEDGEYARILMSRIHGTVLPVFAASMAAARRAGDMRRDGIDPAEAFWFAHHVAAHIALGRLSGSDVFPRTGNLEAVIAEAACFCLRGMGLTERAIARHYRPDAPSALATDREPLNAKGHGFKSKPHQGRLNGAARPPASRRPGESRPRPV